MARLNSTLLVIAVLAILFPSPARADRVEVSTGHIFTGRIVEEDDQELTIEIEDGMRMRIPRSRVVRIERGVESGPPEGRPEVPEPVPPREPAAATPATAAPVDPELCGKGPFDDWNHRHARAPVLRASRTARFRAYTYVSHDPLQAAVTDPAVAGLVLRHGLGGFVARWTLKFAGTRDLQYGDEVKFVGELTFPAGGEPDLVNLEEGPLTHVDRLAVILVKRDQVVRRWFTPAVFTRADFKQDDVRAIEHKDLAVRTYTDGFAPLNVSWLRPKDSEFLSELDSPFGDSLRVRLERLRFRVEWFDTPPEERPGLDSGLLKRKVPRPLATPGGPVAPLAEVLGHWGTPELCHHEWKVLAARVRESLKRIGVTGESACYVERDRIGELGKKGIGLEVQRFSFPADLLESLTR